MPLILIYIYFRYYYREGRDLQERSELMGRSLVSSFTSGSIVWFYLAYYLLDQSDSIKYIYTYEILEPIQETSQSSISSTIQIKTKRQIHLWSSYKIDRQGKILNEGYFSIIFIKIIIPLIIVVIFTQKQINKTVCFRQK